MSLRLRGAGRAAFLDALEAYAADAGLDQPLWIERFRHAAGQTYDEFAGLKNRQGFESLVGLTASSISLVHEDELSFSLELSTFVRKLREACMPQLGVLHRLYLVLLDQKDMPIEQCPVGPDAVARALRALIEAVGLDAEQRQMLLERSLAALGTRLQTLYAELIRMFEEVGVAPRPLGFGSAVRGPQETAAGFSQVRPIPQEGTGGGLAALQERLRKKRQSAAPDAVAIDPELAGAIRERVLSWLAQRQASSDAGAARFAGSELAPLLPAGTAAAVEAVEQVFSAIARFADLGPVARELVAQLQMPFLRLALTDDHLLADPGHPARILLDNVAAAVVTLPQEDREHPTLAQLRDIVGGLQRAEASGAEAFTRAQAVLDHLVSDLKRRENALVRESIDGAERAERRETALVKASAIVDELTSVRAAPAIQGFLERWWVQVLARTLYSHGENHESTHRAIELARLLIDAAGVASASAENGVPTELVAGLKRGLGLLGLGAEASTGLIAPVLNTFALLRSGQLPGGSHVDSSVAPALTEVSGMRPLGLLHHPGYAVITGAAHPAASATLGNWLSLEMPDGSRFAGCMSWIGPQKRVFLLVDASCSASLAVSRRAIVALANQGRCRLIDRSSITERAAARLLQAPAE